MSLKGRVRRAAVRRSEDPGLLVGRTRFLEDVRSDGARHVAFVRSSMAHARIVDVDVVAARAMPGVTDVLNFEDLGGLKMPPVEDLPDAVRRPVLAAGVVRFVGEPIVAVIAATRSQALDAAELVAVDYDPLPPTVDPIRSLRLDAPLLFPDVGSNVMLRVGRSGGADPFEHADVVVGGRFRNQRVAPVPLEVNGALAIPEDGGVTLWLPCQATHHCRSVIAATLGVDETAIRVRTAAVGGGFGAKIPAYAEQVVVAAVARRLDVPVRYVESRSENFVAMTHGRDQLQDVEIGATHDGRLVGLRARIVADLGAYPDEGSTLPGSTVLMAVGPYVIPRLDVEIRCVVTNKTPLGAYRGAGRPEATAMVERAIDMAAAELRLDPAEVRRRNFIRDFPCETVAGARYDTGAYEDAMEEALRLAEYGSLRREQAARRRHGDRVLLGIGIGSYVEVTGWGSEYARVAVAHDGSVVVTTGSSPQGQGHETAFAQIVADRLRVPFQFISVRHSDTAIVPRSEGTMGSRSLQVGGSAVLGAAETLLEEARTLVAAKLEVAPDDIVLSDDGRFEVAGVRGSGLSWAELVREVSGPMGRELLDVEHDFEIQESTYPFGTHVAVVEIDADTGDTRLLRHIAVDDCGVVLNPVLVEGQVHGGIAQGAAQALYEEMVYDDDGTPTTSTLTTYAFPSAAELPSFTTARTETPTPLNPLGAKGIGEAGTIGAMPAVQNAVVDALAHLGVRHVDMPATPERVWRAIVSARDGVQKGGTDGTTGHARADRGDRDADGGGLLGGRDVAPALREVVERTDGDRSGGERGHGGGAPPIR
jgi:carbon-monoxide dehydrogenase large subunit